VVPGQKVEIKVIGCIAAHPAANSSANCKPITNHRSSEVQAPDQQQIYEQVQVTGNRLPEPVWGALTRDFEMGLADGIQDSMT
jgi:hypothetical protein